MSEKIHCRTSTYTKQEFVFYNSRFSFINLGLSHNQIHNHSAVTHSIIELSVGNTGLCDFQQKWL